MRDGEREQVTEYLSAGEQQLDWTRVSDQPLLKRNLKKRPSWLVTGVVCCVELVGAGGLTPLTRTTAALEGTVGVPDSFNGP